MKPIEAIFEGGKLKPLQRLPLAERQRVWVMILSTELSSQEMSHLAATNPSFQFLEDSAEDLYSTEDGQPL